jgi:hypothetical protein
MKTKLKRAAWLEIRTGKRDIGAEHQRQSQRPANEEKHILKLVNGIEE